MHSSATQFAPRALFVPTVVHWLRGLLWLEPLWVLLLALPLTLPGYFLPMRYTPTLILLLFVAWPLRVWIAWYCGQTLRQPLLLPVGGILLALLVSLAVAIDLRLAWLMAGHLALGVALCLALIYWPPAQRWPTLVAGAIIGVALLLSILGPPLMDNAIHSPRAAAFFAQFTPLVQGWHESLNANILAGGLLLAIPLLVALALAPWDAGWWQVGGLLRTSLLLGLVWWLIQVLTLTDSRGALLATAVSLLLLVVLRWPKLTGPVLVLLFFGLVWLLLHDPWTQLNGIMANGMAHDYNSRVEIWARSGRAFRSHWLTGIGIGGFVPLVIEQMAPVRFLLSTQVTHAHNLVLQVGVDLGLLGLLSYVGCMGVSVAGCVRVWRDGQGWSRALASGVLAALVALNVHGLLDAPLWNSKLAFLPWLLFALALLVASQDKAQQMKALQMKELQNS
jgi:O-antigen ligase